MLETAADNAMALNEYTTQFKVKTDIYHNKVKDIGIGSKEVLPISCMRLG